jgi:hypothetical protein
MRRYFCGSGVIEQFMRSRCVSLIFVAGLMGLSACGSHESAEERHEAANTPAGKVGQAAHKVAVEANKAGQAVGRELRQAARDAHEGWKEDARKERAKR